MFLKQKKKIQKVKFVFPEIREIVLAYFSQLTDIFQHEKSSSELPNALYNQIKNLITFFSAFVISLKGDIKQNISSSVLICTGNVEKLIRWRLYTTLVHLFLLKLSYHFRVSEIISDHHENVFIHSKSKLTGLFLKISSAFMWC